MTGSATGTSIGAALLARPAGAAPGPKAAQQIVPGTPEMATYAGRWREAVARG